MEEETVYPYQNNTKTAPASSNLKDRLQDYFKAKNSKQSFEESLQCFFKVVNELQAQASTNESSYDLVDKFLNTDSSYLQTEVDLEEGSGNLFSDCSSKESIDPTMHSPQGMTMEERKLEVAPGDMVNDL